MVGDGQFLDTDPDDMANLTRPHVTPDEDLEEGDDVNGADREHDVKQDAEGSHDDGDDLDDCLPGWGDGGDFESRCELDETMTDARACALDKGNDVTHGNDNGNVSSDKTRRCMFETLTSDPLHNGIESVDNVAHSAVNEDGQRDERRDEGDIARSSGK